MSWAETRDLVFERDGGQCVLCGIEVGFGRPWQVDHITPRIIGGDDDLSNLRLLCVPCHKGETSELARLRAAGRKTIARPDRKPSRYRWPKRKIPKGRPLPKGRKLRG